MPKPTQPGSGSRWDWPPAAMLSLCRSRGGREREVGEQRSRPSPPSGLISGPRGHLTGRHPSHCGVRAPLLHPCFPYIPHLDRPQRASRGGSAAAAAVGAQRHLVGTWQIAARTELLKHLAAHAGQWPPSLCAPVGDGGKASREFRRGGGSSLGVLGEHRCPGPKTQRDLVHTWIGRQAVLPPSVMCHLL